MQAFRTITATEQSAYLVEHLWLKRDAAAPRSPPESVAGGCTDGRPGPHHLGVRTFYVEEIPLRVVVRDGLPWFVAKDVCSAINLSNPSMSVQALDEDERSKFNLGRQGEAVIISESGLYTLVLRCRGAFTPGTVPHRFRRFVTGEVLPQIGETGTYGQPVPASSTAALIEALKNPATALEVIGQYATANLALQ